MPDLMPQVQFTEDNRQIVAMLSASDEIVSLEKPVTVTDHVEVWLHALSDEMASTLKSRLFIL